VLVLGSAVLVLAAVAGPAVFGDAASTRAIAQRQAPASLDHLFGTDELGRDLFARVIVATRVSLLLTLGAAGISLTGGVLFGVLAALLPGPARRAAGGFIDILLSFPWLLLALFFSVVWGATATGAMLAIGFAGIPVFARLVSTLAASIAGTDYLQVARMLGSSPLRTAVRHVLPNILPPVIVNTAAHASVALLSFAALSYLGLGVQAPEYDWGRLLNDGSRRIYQDPMAAIGPGIAIVLTGMLFTLLGQTLSEHPVRTAGALDRDPVPQDADIEADEQDAQALVDVRDLRVAFPDGTGALVERVHGIDLRIEPGQAVGIVGESGSGKSVTAMAIAGLLGPQAQIRSRRLTFGGIDLRSRLTARMRARLGLELAVIFQDPLSSLNPALTIGRQLTEVSRIHGGRSRQDAQRRALEVLEQVRIPEPRRRIRQLPHEFSGGMRQRAMIAMGLMSTPRLLIADEPTTALDVTVQRQVIGALRTARDVSGAAILFISHDIALVSGFCDRIVVMRHGRVVERLDADRLHEAEHPYTRALIACVPDLTTDRSRPLPVIVDADQPADEARPGGGSRPNTRREPIG